jgi:hypothetical protein
MAGVHSCLTILVTVVAVALPSAVYAQKTWQANRFVGSVGINVHLHFNDTLYRDNFPLIKSRLLELGVRHIRDGLVDATEWTTYYDRLNELGAAGIKCTLIVHPDDDIALWLDYPSRVPECFHAYEGPNEFDLNRRRLPDWVEVLRDTVIRLGSIRDVPGLDRYQVYGPSLITKKAYNDLGDISPYIDVANTHHYFAGRNPETRGWGPHGYGSMNFNLRLVDHYSAPMPIVTTEAGYRDDPDAEAGRPSGEGTIDTVPLDIAGIYMPRILLMKFRAGYKRTFLYELADYWKSGSYGLLDEQGAPKPAFTAVKNLLNLLSDPGPQFSVTPLDYSIDDAPGSLYDMAFQKRDGRYYIALWMGVESWDPIALQYRNPKPRTVTLDLPEAMQIRIHRWRRDGLVTQWGVLEATSALQLNVTDTLTIVEATPQGSATTRPFELFVCGLVDCEP